MTDQDLNLYKNIDGTYTSPRNGKIYKSEKALRSHLSFRRTEKFHNFSNLNKSKKNCKFCNEDIGITNIAKHEESCYLNNKNLRLCDNCNNPIRNYKTSKGTCSYSCSNKLFRFLRNKPENYKHYVTICFHFHEKKCVVCEERNIVAVHHYDENHNNDAPENLVPLCPTHHQYIHSRFKNDVIDIIDKYVVQFKNKQGLV